MTEFTESKQEISSCWASSNLNVRDFVQIVHLRQHFDMFHDVHN